MLPSCLWRKNLLLWEAAAGGGGGRSGNEDDRLRTTVTKILWTVTLMVQLITYYRCKFSLFPPLSILPSYPMSYLHQCSRTLRILHHVSFLTSSGLHASWLSLDKLCVLQWHVPDSRDLLLLSHAVQIREVRVAQLLLADGHLQSCNIESSIPDWDSQPLRLRPLLPCSLPPPVEAAALP